MAYNDFTTLKIWQEAHSLALEVYTFTRYFPSIERFGLTNQMRRAAVSVEANIAEGTGRKTTNDFAHFLSMARGSVHEMMSHCMLAQDLGFLCQKALLSWSPIDIKVSRRAFIAVWTPSRAVSNKLFQISD